jgi:hypothetical protein
MKKILAEIEVSWRQGVKNHTCSLLRDQQGWVVIVILIYMWNNDGLTQHGAVLEKIIEELTKMLFDSRGKGDAGNE